MIIDITDSIQKALRSAGVHFTGILPEAIDIMGNLSPMGLISPNSDEIENDQAGIIEANLTLTVFIVTQHGTAKFRQHSDLVYRAINAIYAITGKKVCNINAIAINWNAGVDMLSQKLGSLDIASGITFNIKHKYQRK